MEYLIAALSISTAYLLGSISFAIIFTKAYANKDVRDFGSGNAGMTNVLRVVGKTAGALTFLGDILKGYLACQIGQHIFGYLQNITGNDIFNPIYGAYICGLVCMLGHIFPIYYDFKGGKGVAVSVGIFAVCCPIAIACGLACFLVVLLISRIISISSLCATVVVVTLSMVFYNSSAMFWPQAALAVAMGVLVIVKHRENIGRLIRGEEKKLFVKKGD